MIDPTSLETSSLDLEALEKLFQAATKGPWRCGFRGYDIRSDVETEQAVNDRVIIATNPWGARMSTEKQIDQWLSDSELIVELRNSLPALLSELRAWRSQQGLRCRGSQHVAFTDRPTCECGEIDNPPLPQEATPEDDRTKIKS